MKTLELEIAATVTRGAVRCSAWLGASFDASCCGLSVWNLGLPLEMLPWREFDVCSARRTWILINVTVSGWIDAAGVEKAYERGVTMRTSLVL